MPEDASFEVLRETPHEILVLYGTPLSDRRRREQNHPKFNLKRPRSIDPETL